jgi:hypothetical protein
MAFKYTYKGLDKVAEVYKTLALSLIKNGYPGWKKAKSSPTAAPYVSGNLYNRVKDYNQAEKMATYRPTRSNKKIELPQVTISLNFAPPGARYGENVEKGTGNSSGVGPKPFAELASKDQQLKKAIDAVLTGNDGPINVYSKMLAVDLGNRLKKGGFVKV